MLNLFCHFGINEYNALLINLYKEDKLQSILKKIHINIYKKFLKIIGTTSDKTSRNLFRLFQFAIYAVLIVFFINIFSFGKSTFGEWGDFFGGVLNPILTFLTFMGLLITIVLQQKELKASRIEFNKSADALLDQSESFRKQNFESTFFKLLEKFESQSVHLISIYDDSIKKHATNRDIRHFGFESLRNQIYHYQEYYTNGTERCNSQCAYSGLFKQGSTQILLEDYFKNFKFIINFIENSGLTDKGMYYKIFFSDLTNGEQILLFYHVLYADTMYSFKLIIEKYSLFEYLGWKGLADDGLDLIKYNISAYGNNHPIIVAYEHCINKIKEAK